MSKIDLKAKLISADCNLDIQVKALQTKNKIVYKENNIIVTILIGNNKIEMNRSCNEYDINLVFEKNKKTISTYSVFGGKKQFDLETITKKIIIEEKLIEIDYELEGNDFSYSLRIGG